MQLETEEEIVSPEDLAILQKAQEVLFERVVSEFSPLAHSLANRIQRDEEDHLDLYHVGLIAVVKTFQKMEGEIIRDEGRLASTTMTRAMHRSLKWRRKGPVEEYYDPHIHIDWEEELGILEDVDEYFYIVLKEGFLDEVGRLLGSTARRIAEELVDPSLEVLTLAQNSADMRESARKSSGRKRRPSPVVVKHTHIKQVLGIKSGEWHKNLRAVRELALDFAA